MTNRAGEAGPSERDGIQVVPIDAVKPWSSSRPWSTYKMKKVLEKQGQIIPLQVNKQSNHTYFLDPWGDEIWYAAKDLGWDTLLVLFNDRFEE